MLELSRINCISLDGSEAINLKLKSGLSCKYQGSEIRSSSFHLLDGSNFKISLTIRFGPSGIKLILGLDLVFIKVTNSGQDEVELSQGRPKKYYKVD